MHCVGVRLGVIVPLYNESENIQYGHKGYIPYTPSHANISNDLYKIKHLSCVFILFFIFLFKLSRACGRLTLGSHWTLGLTHSLVTGGRSPGLY